MAVSISNPIIVPMNRARQSSHIMCEINVWNKLSTDCVNASRVNMFKDKIDECLRRAGYT